jgi:tRNA(Arg) A34 adenosine deaminase TadA
MKYLDLATRIAKANYTSANEKHFLFGAVCLRQDGALVISHNIRTQDPNIGAHAESRVLRKSGHGSILFLVRINRHGQWAMAKPCPGCSSLIRNRNVKRVYYSVEPNTYAVWDVQ